MARRAVLLVKLSAPFNVRFLSKCCGRYGKDEAQAERGSQRLPPPLIPRGDSLNMLADLRHMPMPLSIAFISAISAS